MNTELQDAIAALGRPAAAESRSVTSDLSIDESLLLHSHEWEPTDLVTGVSVQSVPLVTWNRTIGQSEPIELGFPTHAVTNAFKNASEQLRRDCNSSGGHGVIGVEVELEIERRTIRIAFTGTAVRPIARGHATVERPFVTDLSTKDFVLLARAGWRPLELAYGASFVLAPYQRVRQFVSQVRQNVELVNLTNALQQAREKAMERMQRSALDEGATGVVDVSIMDGPLTHSAHVLAFVCYGTSVKLAGDQHQRIEPEMVVSLDDDVAAFRATALRGE
jgi:uncharacterized protein YbjQ (UPF0145 family)